MSEQQSVTVSPSSNGGTGATATIVDTGRNLTWLLGLNAALLVVVAVLSGVSIAMSITTQQIVDQRLGEVEHRHAQRIGQLADQTAIAEREARVLQERLADMKVELVKRGIPLSDH
jgi:hypothetical protein